MSERMARRFEGRIAFVTGGAGGIGFAVVQRLRAEGARVVVWDSDAAALEALSQSEGDALGTAVVDITDDAAVEAAAAAVETGHGGIDILVHAAGIAGPSAPVVDYSAADWRRVVDIDLNGAFFVNKAVVRRMIGRGRGRIVNIASAPPPA